MTAYFAWMRFAFGVIAMIRVSKARSEVAALKKSVDSLRKQFGIQEIPDGVDAD